MLTTQQDLETENQQISICLKIVTVHFKLTTGTGKQCAVEKHTELSINGENFLSVMRENYRECFLSKQEQQLNTTEAI